jgi:hypothetical protein
MPVIKKTNRKETIKTASNLLEDIILHTKDLTIQEWSNEDVQYEIKDALMKFISFIRDNRISDYIEELKDFDNILEYCIDGKHEEKEFVLLFIKSILPIVLKEINSHL